jgi:hypothetical protein
MMGSIRCLRDNIMKSIVDAGENNTTKMCSGLANNNRRLNDASLQVVSYWSCTIHFSSDQMGCSLVWDH